MSSKPLFTTRLDAALQLAPLHHAQLLNYMRVAHVGVGLLMNFNVAVLRDGVTRKVL